MKKHKWAQIVKQAIRSHETILTETQLKSRLSLSRYCRIRSDKEHRLWKLALEMPSKFYDIARIVHIGTSPLRST